MSPICPNTPSTSVREWIAAFEEDVRTGRVGLLELVDMALSDLEQEWELCPACSAHPVREHAGAYGMRGLCSVCVLKHLTDAHAEVYAKLVATREYNVAKKQLSRKREELGVRAPRRAADYGRASMLGTDHPIMAECDICDEPFVPRGDAATCPACLERAERHARARGCACA